MKKVILSGIIFMMFMGIANASSHNGEFEGSPIVTLMSGGNVVGFDDVPAIIYKGRTMVPISLLRNIGAQVTWNQENYSIDVELPKASVVNNVVSDNSAVLIKYAKLANMYKIAQDISGQIVNLSSTLGVYFTGHNSNLPNAFTDKMVIDSLSQTIDNYNYLSNKYNATLSAFADLDSSSLINAIKADYDAIDKYKLAVTEILAWNSYKLQNDNSDSQASFNSYIADSSSGFSLANQSITNCLNGYNLYILKVVG